MSESSGPKSVFPRRLREARETAEWSQADLAARSGLQPSAVSHFETGRRAPSFDNLRRLADALGVTTDYLLGRSDAADAAGPVVEQLFRDLGAMSEADRNLIAEMAKFLLSKEKDAPGAGA